MNCDVITLVYHFGGRWVHIPSLEYIEGREAVESGDIDFLSVTHMVKKYREEFGMSDVKKLCYLKPRKSLENGLKNLENDDGINDMVAMFMELDVSNSIHVYPVNDVGDALIIGTQFNTVTTKLVVGKGE